MKPPIKKNKIDQSSNNCNLNIQGKCDKNFGVQSVNRQTDTQTDSSKDSKVKTEGPNI